MVDESLQPLIVTIHRGFQSLGDNRRDRIRGPLDHVLESPQFVTMHLPEHIYRGLSGGLGAADADTDANEIRTAESGGD